MVLPDSHSVGLPLMYYGFTRSIICWVYRLHTMGFPDSHSMGFLIWKFCYGNSLLSLVISISNSQGIFIVHMGPQSLQSLSEKARCQIHHPRITGYCHFFLFLQNSKLSAPWDEPGVLEPQVYTITFDLTHSLFCCVSSRNGIIDVTIVCPFIRLVDLKRW